jgi:hypothetical protein
MCDLYPSIFSFVFENNLSTAAFRDTHGYNENSFDVCTWIHNNNNNIFLFHQAVTRNKQGYNKHWSVKIY